MHDLFTPKQVARAIQVSESSVKRWCDKGLIPTQYTAGGHRRISLTSLLEFLKAGGHQLVQPEVLGLPATSGQTVWVLDRASEYLSQALLAGDEDRCRSVIFDLFLAEHSIARICDEVIARAFEVIGDRWACGAAEVFQERRGCEIILRLVRELRAAVHTPLPGAPVAIGGSSEGDPYNVASSMVELVLRDSRWNATNLGNNLPFDTLLAAVREHHPRLFWLSCSHILDVEEFLAQYAEFQDQCGAMTAVAVGGKALTPAVRQRMKYASYCDTMGHLESFAQSLVPAN